MTTFLQFHLLTSYPPANLNRDDLGRPKQAQMGGANRIRISSQSLKRAWRTSSVFEEALAGNIGIRTKRIGCEAYKRLTAAGMDDKKTTKIAQAIATVFGKLKSDKKANKDKLEHIEIETLAHVAPEEQEAVHVLCDTLAAEDREPTTDELDLLRKGVVAADIALFGRMLAARPDCNIDAACQVGHAITVHKAAAEDDFFTAVDDLNSGEEDRGSGHMGDIEFAAGLYYLYICVDIDGLTKNLQGDIALAKKTLEALVESACTVAPTGKQNSFASRAYAGYCLAEKGSRQPRNLSCAFLQPVIGTNMLNTAIENIDTTRTNMARIYGDVVDADACFNVSSGAGTLADIKAFAAGCCDA